MLLRLYTTTRGELLHLEFCSTYISLRANGSFSLEDALFRTSHVVENAFTALLSVSSSVELTPTVSMKRGTTMPLYLNKARETARSPKVNLNCPFKCMRMINENCLASIEFAF